MSWLCRTLGHKWKLWTIEVKGRVTTEEWRCKRCKTVTKTHDFDWR